MHCLVTISNKRNILTLQLVRDPTLLCLQRKCKYGKPTSLLILYRYNVYVYIGPHLLFLLPCFDGSQLGWSELSARACSIPLKMSGSKLLVFFTGHYFL